MGGNIVEVRGLTKRYDGFIAVENVDLSVKTGEVFGFLGPNGGGKTTTIKAILGMLGVDSGSGRIFDKLVQDGSSNVLNRVGYLPENVELYDNLTGEETLEFFSKIKNVKNSVSRDLLDDIGLSNAIDKKVGEYSKGMKQRLAIAQALIGDPPLLVLDEPTGGLDPKGVSTVKNIVKDYSKNGGTVFFSSHILPNVEDVADRVGIIREGKLLSVGPIGELREKTGGTVRLRLDISDDINNIENYLEESDEVIDYFVEERSVIVVCRSEDKRKIMNSVENEGVSILDFGIEEKDLEDIFLEITEGGQNA